MTDRRVPKQRGSSTTTYTCGACKHEWQSRVPDKTCPKCGGRQVKRKRTSQ